MRISHTSRITTAAFGAVSLLLPLTAMAPATAAPAKPAPTTTVASAKTANTVKVTTPTLRARAQLSADHLAKGPDSGA